MMGHKYAKSAVFVTLQTYFLFLCLFHWSVLLCLNAEAEKHYLHLSWHCAPEYQPPLNKTKNKEKVVMYFCCMQLWVNKG